MKVAVLAVQGAFAEHIRVLSELGIETMEIRKKEDAEAEFDGLVLPGGESTVQGKLIRELGILEILKEKIQQGIPVLATCAGLILLAENISDHEDAHLKTLPVKVRRNAYGRQLGSFRHTGALGSLSDFPMEFIRAPLIESVAENVEVLALVDGKITGVRYKNQLAVSFHPELTEDPRLHQKLAELIESRL